MKETDVYARPLNAGLNFLCEFTFLSYKYFERLLHMSKHMASTSSSPSPASLRKEEQH